MVTIVAGAANGLTLLGGLLLLLGIPMFFSSDGPGEGDPFFLGGLIAAIAGGVLMATHWGS
jgi:hypothetical protein